MLRLLLDLEYAITGRCFLAAWCNRRYSQIEQIRNWLYSKPKFQVGDTVLWNNRTLFEIKGIEKATDGKLTYVCHNANQHQPYKPYCRMFDQMAIKQEVVS